MPRLDPAQTVPRVHPIIARYVFRAGHGLLIRQVRRAWPRDVLQHKQARLAVVDIGGFHHLIDRSGFPREIVRCNIPVKPTEQPCSLRRPRGVELSRKVLCRSQERQDAVNAIPVIAGIRERRFAHLGLHKVNARPQFLE
jgi:hypothetical protein